jgi:hypothetical protein
MTPVSRHASRHAERLEAFGLTQDKAQRLVSRVRSKNAGVVIGKSNRLLWAGKSNGYYLIAIVRGGSIITYLLSRDLDGKRLGVPIILYAV